LFQRLSDADCEGPVWHIMQIVPDNMEDILANGTREEVKRIIEAFLKMKRLDIAAL